MTLEPQISHHDRHTHAFLLVHWIKPNTLIVRAFPTPRSNSALPTMSNEPTTARMNVDAHDAPSKYTLGLHPDYHGEQNVPHRWIDIGGRYRPSNHECPKSYCCCLRDPLQVKDGGL